VTAFAEMMTARTGRRDLEAWLAAVEADDRSGLRSLATGIRYDQQAVTNGLTLHWNSGRVEGTVNKIKMIKRQMYGRAGFDLLRKRVILHPALPRSQNSRQSQFSCPRGDLNPHGGEISPIRGYSPCYHSRPAVGGFRVCGFVCAWRRSRR
jgi:Transposase